MTPGRYLVDGVLYRAGKRCWTSDEDAVLRVLYPDAPNDVIARFLERTTTAINARGDILGLHKSPMYLASPAACRLRRGGGAGVAYRYPKGHVPANKGTRRPGWHTGRMQETQFKKGVATNWHPVGSTRVSDGYIYRKISDIRNVPWTRNWVKEHARVWEAANGPIPVGHKLVFRNGDRQDIRIENLELVTDAEVMRRNTIHNLPPALKKAVRQLASLKRQIRRKTRDTEEHDRRSA